MDPGAIETLKAMLATQQVAALATLHKGEPAVSMVPFALLPQGGGLVIHVSRLATHTGDMLAHTGVSLLVIAPPAADVMAQATPRVAMAGQARPCRADDTVHAKAQQAYLGRFPESEPMFGFGDFSLFVIEVRSVRLVTGFGKAHSLTPAAFAQALANPGI
jgi:putative heme iron utilization protein